MSIASPHLCCCLLLDFAVLMGLFCFDLSYYLLCLIKFHIVQKSLTSFGTPYLLPLFFYVTLPSGFLKLRLDNEIFLASFCVFCSFFLMFHICFYYVGLRPIPRKSLHGYIPFMAFIRGLERIMLEQCAFLTVSVFVQ